jgi:DNA repair protein RadC
MLADRDATEPTVAIPFDELPRAKKKPRPAPRYIPASRRWSGSRGPVMKGAAEVWAHLRHRLEAARVEEVWMLAVDVRHRVIEETMVARGSMTSVEIHPRDCFRSLIEQGAAAVIFVHNHPSGDPTPSRHDVDVTQRLRDTGDICGIVVLDHIVIGSEGFTSLAERNWK